MNCVSPPKEFDCKYNISKTTTQEENKWKQSDIKHQSKLNDIYASISNYKSKSAILNLLILCKISN